jgi:RNA-binding protein 25
VVVEEPSDILVSRIMTKEERLEAVKELVATIPADREGLWSWPVKWEHLNPILLQKKIEPFLKKKVLEYIGDESLELVKFIIEKLGSQQEIQSIFDELEPVRFQNVICRFW